MSAIITSAQVDVPSSAGSVPLLTLSDLTEPLVGLLTNGFCSLGVDCLTGVTPPSEISKVIPRVSLQAESAAQRVSRALKGRQGNEDLENEYDRLASDVSLLSKAVILRLFESCWELGRQTQSNSVSQVAHSDS